MRERRSSSGEGGSVVIDCCFMVVAAGSRGTPLRQAYVRHGTADAP
jgi:hypothetical protein